MSEARVIGKYELQAAIGKGPRGSMFRAVHQETKRGVAIKVLGHEAIDSRAVQPFQKVAQSLTQLQHPGIARLVDVFEAEGRLCLVFEFVQGTPLSALLKDGAYPEPKKAWDVLRQTLEALAYAHQHGAVHRDLKPSNIVLNAEGAVVLTDFGVSVVYAPRSEGAEFFSPEHFSEDQLTTRSDIYQMGVIAYQLVTGKLPFTGTPAEVAHRVAEERPADPSSFNNHLAWQLDWVIQKALSKDPGERFNAAIDFAEGLRLGLQDTVGRGLPPAQAPSAPKPAPPAAKPAAPPAKAAPAPAKPPEATNPVEAPKPAEAANPAPAKPPEGAKPVGTPPAPTIRPPAVPPKPTGVPRQVAPPAKPAPGAPAAETSTAVPTPAAKPAAAIAKPAEGAKPVPAAVPKPEPATKTTLELEPRPEPAKPAAAGIPAPGPLSAPPAPPTSTAAPASALLQNAKVLAGKPVAPVPSDRNKPGVLFVDDDPRILNSLRALFRQEYNVQTAESGEAALAIMEAGGIQVVVSDQRMPNMTGVDLLRRIRTVAPNAVRMLLTGYTDLASLVGSINQGEIFRFVMKPWDNDELKKSLAEAFKLATELATTEPAKPAAPRSAGSLLVIDPSEGVAQGLERLLAGSARVIRVETPAEAAKVLSKEEIAALVADMGSGMDGLVALFREIRAKLPGVLSILLTDEPDSDLAIELINRAQIFRLLPKPVNARDLRTQVAEALRRYSIYKQRAAAGLPGLKAPGMAASATRPVAS